jgi:hypothetical protein
MAENLIESMAYCATQTFLAVLRDLPFIPIFILCALLTPWRLYWSLKRAFLASEAATYED